MKEYRLQREELIKNKREARAKGKHSLILRLLWYSDTPRLAVRLAPG